METLNGANGKRAAARAAAERIEDGCRLGIGGGSTVAAFIPFLGERVRAGLEIRAIAASKESEALARAEGIPLASAEELFPLDLLVDGSDELDAQLRLVKGGGGALLHEKILAAAARRFWVIAEERKLVERLGRFPLPVEVAPFGCAGTVTQVREVAAAFGCAGEVGLRRRSDGSPWASDGGHWICDCAFGAIADAETLAAALEAVPGVLGHGLFLGMAERAFLGDASARFREVLPAHGF